MLGVWMMQFTRKIGTSTTYRMLERGSNLVKSKRIVIHNFCIAHSRVFCVRKWQIYFSPLLIRLTGSRHACTRATYACRDIKSICFAITKSSDKYRGLFNLDSTTVYNLFRNLNSSLSELSRYILSFRT